MHYFNKLISVRGFRSCAAYYILWVLLSVTFSEASAQTLPSRRYTTRDGLLADRVTVIAQDHEGYMWMGSLFGLSKYDGSRFTTIQLPALQQHRYVTSILAADRKVYAGFLFGGGIIQYAKGIFKLLSFLPVKNR